MALAYLLLGSNIENKSDNLAKAKAELLEAKTQLLKESHIYETEPWGFKDPENFLNQVLLVNTFLKPDRLLKLIKKIEKKAGRTKRKLSYESRIIDIDILLYDEEIINQEDIKVPHPLLHLRRFTLVPLSEIAPSLIHPVLKKEIKVLLKECKDKSKIWLQKKLI